MLNIEMRQLWWVLYLLVLALLVTLPFDPLLNQRYLAFPSLLVGGALALISLHFASRGVSQE